MLKVRESFSLPKLAPWKTETVGENQLVGIEIEIENVVPKKPVGPPPMWTVTTDGSLRNNGVEYVSLPLHIKDARNSLDSLMAQFAKYSVSPRCSTHVHFNMRDRTQADLKKIWKLYMHVEQSLFKFIGQNRHRNIYCIPLWDTLYGTTFDTFVNIEKQYVNWSKYTALNFAPLKDKGTIEFRHFPGLTDVTKYVEWINILNRMVRCALEVNPKRWSIDRLRDELRIEVYPVDFNNARLLFGEE